MLVVGSLLNGEILFSGGAVVSKCSDCSGDSTDRMS